MRRRPVDRSILEVGDLIDYEGLLGVGEVVDTTRLLAQTGTPTKVPAAAKTIETLFVYDSSIKAMQANKIAELRYVGAELRTISSAKALATLLAEYQSIGILVLFVHSGQTKLQLGRDDFTPDDPKLLDLFSEAQTLVRNKIVFEGCSIGRNLKALSIFASQFQAPMLEAFTWPHYLGRSRVKMSPDIKTLDEFRKKWDERAHDDKEPEKILPLDKLEKFTVAPDGKGLNHYVLSPDSDNKNARTVWYEFLDPANSLTGDKVVPHDGTSIPLSNVDTKNVPGNFSLDDAYSASEKQGWRFRLKMKN